MYGLSIAHTKNSFNQITNWQLQRGRGGGARSILKKKETLLQLRLNIKTICITIYGIV